MESDIRLDLAILYYPNFYNYVLKWMHDLDTRKAREEKLPMLKTVLEYHSIYEIDRDKAWMNELPLEESCTRITWDSLMSNYFKRKDKVRIKATGEVFDVGYAFIDKDELGESSIHIDRGTGHYDSSTDNFKLKDVEKV